MRIMHEAQMHDRNCFITLTYDDEHMPEDGSVDVRDWQLFAKRLRQEKGKFRYFHCGEYGTDLGRPHYHACLFGLDFRADRVRVKKSDSGADVDRSPDLERIWGKGICAVGNLEMGSALYVAKYVTKKITGSEAGAHYGDRRPEYCSMSRRPGLGRSWFDQFASDVFPSDECVVEGKRYPVPEFYTRLLEELPQAEVRGKRIGRANRRREKTPEDFTPERLRVRERVHKARNEFFERK